MKRMAFHVLRHVFVVFVAAGFFMSGGFPSVAPRADAQAPCGGSPLSGETAAKIKATLKEMSTTDPALIKQNIASYQKLVDHWQILTPGQSNAATRLYGDALEFWREKQANLELGDMAEVHSGQRWRKYLEDRLAQADQAIVGTWNWWNGYTVTFNANGGATYQGSSLARSGVGRWQKTGGGNYHVHWMASNTDDYFTVSSDGTKIEGKFDGKPGVSTRRC